MSIKGKKNLDDLKVKSTHELNELITTLKRDQFLARSVVSSSGEKKGMLNKIRHSKKQIARILTIIRERELQEMAGAC